MQTAVTTLTPVIPANELVAWDCHAGTGPHLLLVHGFLSSAAQWSLNLEALQAFCRPVTVELFGHGRSPSPANPECYRPAHYLRCFETIRQCLGIDRWFVLGYSLGAGLTIRYALEHPDRVIGHLFTNSSSGLADTEQIAAWRSSTPAAANAIRAGGHKAMERIPVHPKHARKLPRSVVADLLRDAQLHDPEGIACTLEITNPEVSVRARVGENCRPAALLLGNREQRFKPHKSYVEANMPELTIVELDAGHGMNMEVPAAFNQAVQKFIRECLAATPS